MIPEHPFAPIHSRQSFLETSGAGEALRRLEDALGAREPFLVVTGEPGTGKTALAHEAIARWEGRVTAAFLAYPALTGAELLEEIVLRFGAQPPDGATRPKLVACLERAFADIAGGGRVAMIVVDDAHRLPAELLEELRLLVNAARQPGRPLEVLLLGLPSLEAVFDHPALAALRQRVSVRAKLEPLPEGETRRYLRHRVDAAGGDGASLFPRKTCSEIAVLSGGVPRRVDTLAAAALRLARASGSAAVQPEHVKAAVPELQGTMPARAADDPRDDEREGSPVGAALPHAPAKPSAPRTANAPVPPPPAPPTSHDPREWVARFVGDRGPVQIGSQVASRSTWKPETLEPAAAQAQGNSGTPRPRPAAADGGHSRSRSRRGRGLRVATTAVLVTSVAIAATLAIVRSRGLAPGRARAVAVTTAVAAPPHAAPAVPVVVVRAPEAATATVTGAGPSAVPAVSPNGRYTLEVGGSADLQTAIDERDRMQELTGLEGWVVPAPDGVDGPHRIVLGIYRSYERAAAAAQMLVGSRTLGEATVVPLPPRHSRL